MELRRPAPLKSASYPPALRSAQANLNVPEPLQSVPPQSAQERTGASPAVGVKAVRSKRFGTAGPPAGKRFCPYWKGKACGGRFLPADPARRRHAGAGVPAVRLRRKACRMYGWRRHPVWPTPERRRLGDASKPRCSTCLGCGNRGPDGFSDPRLSVAPVGGGGRRACPATSGPSCRGAVPFRRGPHRPE